MSHANSTAHSSMHHKIQRYHSFLKYKLYPDLQQVNTRLAELKSQRLIYAKLHDTIDSLHQQYIHCQQTNQQYINTLTNLGHDIYSEAIIDTYHTHTIYMNIGCNILIEMSLDEAMKHCQYKTNAIDKLMTRCNIVAASIKTQTKTVYEAINELIRINRSDT